MLNDFDDSFFLISDMKEPDGSTSLHKAAQFQTVLIAYTGKEEGLGAPKYFFFFWVCSLTLFPLRQRDFIRPENDIIEGFP